MMFAFEIRVYFVYENGWIVYEVDTIYDTKV